MPSHDGIHYHEEGLAAGTVVLMLHGYPQSSYMWRYALPAAAQVGWRALAPDLPGFGDSPPIRRAPGSARSRRWSASGRGWGSTAWCSWCTTGAA